MAGTVFKNVLGSLRDEGHELAPAVEAFMRNRTMVGLTVPSGTACPQGSGGACTCANCTAATGPAACPSEEAIASGDRCVEHGAAWARYLVGERIAEPPGVPNGPPPSPPRTIVFYTCDAWVNNPFPFGSEFAWDSAWSSGWMGLLFSREAS